MSGLQSIRHGGPNPTLQHHREAGRGGGGFTLVELLVVIGVIALVIAMVFPALARAREAARTVACASNIRQIGLANFAYANRHGGRLPVPVLGNTNTLGLVFGLPQTAIWATGEQGTLDYTQGTLIPDLGGPDVAQRLFMCPSDDNPLTYDKIISLVGDNQQGFTVTSRVYNARPRNFSYVWNGEIVTWDPRRSYGTIPITQIRRPDRKVLLFETSDANGLAPLPAAYDAITWEDPPHLYIGLRHHNRSNVFFADGHVELFDSLTLRDKSVTSIVDNAVWVKYFRIESE